MCATETKMDRDCDSSNLKVKLGEFDGKYCGGFLCTLHICIYEQICICKLIYMYLICCIDRTLGSMAFRTQHIMPVTMYAVVFM